MDDLTLPVKELINVGLKVCSIFNLFLFYLAWKCFVSTKAYLSSDNGSLTCHGNDNENQDQEDGNIKPSKLSFASVTKIGLSNLLN